MAVSKKTLLFILINGTMFFVGFLENIKGVSYPLIKTEFGVSYEEQGRMVSLLSFSYTFFCIAAGFMLSRFGVKKVYLLGFVLAICGLLAVFVTPGFWSTASALFLVFSCFGLFEIGINGLASVLFTGKAALLMNLLHFFYGAGAVISPRAAGILCRVDGIGWRHIYLFSVPLALVFFVPAIIARFPRHEKPGTSEGTAAAKNGFIAALRTPMVWFFGISLGLMVVIEMASSNWGSLYFQDVYGMDPTTTGAGFVSAFFVLFTVSRLLSGFAIEKIGYMKSLAGAVLFITGIFAAGFALGKTGVFVLPALGFFIAILWPTTMAVAIRYFGDRAAVMTSAVIAIGGLFNALMQLLTGYVNSFLGAEWGYRGCLILAVVLFFMLLKLNRLVRPGKPPEAARNAKNRTF